jgi:hypothetical protein
VFLLAEPRPRKQGGNPERESGPRREEEPDARCFAIPERCQAKRSAADKLLVDYFLRRYNLELGREIRQVAPEAMGQIVGAVRATAANRHLHSSAS